MPLDGPPAAGNGAPILRIELLGTFRVSAGDRELPGHAWRSRNAAGIVASLALAPGYTLHREQLAEWLWPGLDPRLAANNLRQALHVARRRLRALPLDHAAVLRTRDERVQLYPPECIWTDVADIETAARTAVRADDPAAVWAAIDRYPGPLLPADPYADCATARREALAAQHLALLERAARLHEARGEPAQAIAALGRVVVAEPAHEAAHARLMALYAETGQPALALRQYRRLAEALAREFDARPMPETEALRDTIERAARARRPATPDMAPESQLPVILTSFIGREADSAQLMQLIGRQRLVTLIGTGGSGKTRLAIEVARGLAARFPGGVCLVELAPLSDPAVLVGVIAEALRVRETPGAELAELVAEQLRERQPLLVLDNCEHLLRGVAEVTRRLLAACPALRIVCTSRAPLGVAGEARWPVAPLATPTHDRLPLEQLAAVPAARLFIERTRQNQPSFALTVDNASAVTAICRGLDGLPLALELAAARTNVLAPAQIAARLEDSLRLLVGGNSDLPERHRALRATLEWSARLLAPAERALFRRLAVFSGGWMLEAAEAVCADAKIEREQVLDLLGGLVDQSLVLAREDGDARRFYLLEPVRQYAWELLEGAGELSDTRDRHAEHLTQWAEAAERGLAGPAQSAWLERLEREHDNLRAALAWALERDGATILRLAAALAGFWELRGRPTEGRAWLERALTTADPSLDLRARVLKGAGTLAWRQGDYARAAEFHEHSLAAYRRLGDRHGVALGLINLGAQALNLGDYERAETCLAEGLRLADEIDDDNARVMALINLGLTALGRGDDARSERYFEEGLPVAARLGNAHFMAVTLQNLGEIAQRRGDEERALTLHRESLALAVQLDARVLTAFCLEEVAVSYVARGAAEQAARLFGAAGAIREATHAPPAGGYRTQLYDPAVAEMRAQLGARAFKVAWAAGAQLPLDVAVAEAQTPLPKQLNPLSSREADVAALVARGQTNRQIAATLGIAERTVDTHVGHILRKLGVATRQQVAGRLDERDTMSATA